MSKATGALKERPAATKRARPQAASRKVAAVRQTVFPWWAAPAGILLIALAFAAWGVGHVHGYTYPAPGSWIGPHGWSDYDEGVYLVSARLLNQHYALFSDIFSSQPPLFLAGLAFYLRVFNDAAGAGYLYSLTCGLLALGGVAWLCWETVGRWSALLATLVLAVSPGFIIASHAVEAEAPMMAFTSLSVAAAARYARTRHRIWLILSALLLATGTLSKLLAVSAVLPVAVALLFATLGSGVTPAWRRFVRDGLLATACVAAPILVEFAILSPARQFDQVIRFHTQSSKIPGLADPTWTTFSTFLGWDIGLLGLAVAGVGAVAALRIRLSLLQITWLLATLASVVPYYPLFIHHLTVLLPPLAAVAGGAFAALDHARAPRMRRLPAGLLLVVGLLVYLLWFATSTADRTVHTFAADTDAVKAAQVAWLKANSGPDDWVVTDNQVLAVAAHRLVPPALCDTSNVRGASGYLPLAVLEQNTDDPHVRAVLLMRTLMYNPAYVQWLGEHFHKVVVPQIGGALTFVR